MFCGAIGEVGFMDGNDGGLVGGHSLKRFFQIVSVFKSIVHANHPDSLAVSLHGQRLVAQDIQTMAIERISHDVGTVPMVVVAENRQDRSSGQLLQDFGTGDGVTGALRAIGLKEGVGDEIAGKDGEIGLQREGQLDRAFDLRFADVGPEMHVAHDNDAKSVEGIGQTAKLNADFVDDGNMGLDQETVDGGGSA